MRSAWLRTLQCPPRTSIFCQAPGPTWPRRRGGRRRWRCLIRGRRASTRVARSSWRCLGLQARRGAAAAVPGQPERADPRADLQAGGGRGGVQQGAGHQRARQPRGAQPQAGAAVRRAGGGARAVPRLLLAGAHLRPRAEAGRTRSPSTRAAARAAPPPRSRPLEQLQKLEAQAARARREALRAARRQGDPRRGAEAAARRGGRRRSRPTPPSPTRTTTPRPRPATTSSTCCSRRRAGRSTSRATASIEVSRHAERARARASSTTCCGATTASRWRWSRPSAPGETRGSASSRPSSMPMPGAAVRPAAGDLLHQRLRALALGRRQLPAAARCRASTRRRAGAADPAARSTRKPLADAEINAAIVERYYQTRAHPPHRRGVRARPRSQGAAGDGDRRRQDAHGDRAVRPADALQLGQAGAVPRRPRGAGEPGGERLQEAPAGCVAGEPGDREGHRRPRLRLDLSRR